MTNLNHHDLSTVQDSSTSLLTLNLSLEDDPLQAPPAVSKIPKDIATGTCTSTNAALNDFEPTFHGDGQRYLTEENARLNRQLHQKTLVHSQLLVKYSQLQTEFQQAETQIMQGTY